MINTNRPGFSVIVCFFNAVERLEPTLRHLAALKIPDGWELEVILVDNNSTDGSTALAEKIWFDQPSNVRVSLNLVHEGLAGLINARKRGLSLAKMSHIIYCDDDNWLHDDYLIVLADLITRFPDVAAFGGLGNPISSIPLPSFFQWVGVAFGTGPQQPESGYKKGIAPWLYGAGMCVDRQALSQVMATFPFELTKGRNGKLLTGGDDNELCYKLLFLGYKLYYEERLTFDHFMDAKRLNIDYYRRLMAGSAFSNALLISLLMHYKTSFQKALKRRLHWKTGYLRMLRYGMIARRLGKDPSLLENKDLFERFRDSYYAFEMLKATIRHKNLILRNYTDIQKSVSKISWNTIVDQ